MQSHSLWNMPLEYGLAFRCRRPSQGGQHRSSVVRPAMPLSIAEHDAGPEAGAASGAETPSSVPATPFKETRVPLNVVSGNLPGLIVAPDLQYIDFRMPNEASPFKTLKGLVVAPDLRFYRCPCAEQGAAAAGSSSCAALRDAPQMILSSHFLGPPVL